MTSTASPAPTAGLLTLRAPVSGLIVPLGQVPDPVFAERLAGDGAAIEPLSDCIVAPCDATVLQIHGASHAVTIEAAGLEIIIHVGLDTVLLRGDGFTPLVPAGTRVREGTPLLRFDPDVVGRRARSLLTEVVVANMQRVAGIDVESGYVTAGKDALLRVRLVADAGGSGDTAGGANVTSPPIRITAEGGLHARPAATITAAVRAYASDVRLVKDGREANARSVVAIMALEVGADDTVTVVARGDDAFAAVDAVTRLLTSASEEHAPSVSAPAPSRAVAGAAAPTMAGELRGVAASPGLAIGYIHHVRHDETVREERAADPVGERRALDDALGAARLQLQTLRERLASEADGEKAAIFAAHEELLEDPEVLERADAEIRGGASAAFAWQQAYDAQARRLAALGNPLLAARATDMRDVGRRVLQLLMGGTAEPADIPADAILVAEDFAPSDVASIDRARVRGFCTTTGSATSHVAILARGLGIPAVAGMDPRVLSVPVGTRALLDGDAGVLRTELTAADEAAAVARQGADARRRARDLEAATSAAITRDGHRVEVVANIGDVADAARVVEVGGEGVGLLRSEFLFMHRDTAPSEDEQTATYEAIARTLGPDRILVIRTLDVGGDKPLSYLSMPSEANPFLGERGVRLTLARPELFRAQIRAILRTSRSGKVAIMFPMIATRAEWRAASAMVEAERTALGVAPIPVGIMVETAAAALMAEQFAREASFLSLGTNDLTQYTLAMDRTNPRLAPQVDALHPSVLRLIQETARGARAHGRWVGVCGALAGDLTAVPILIGLGVGELSVDIPIVPAVKARVRELSLAECRAVAEQALAAGDGAEVREIVARMHDRTQNTTERSTE